MPLTLISHFWNEEFLLPYWLRHHYSLFDHGVLLDYASTDRSVEIIHDLAPRWEVRSSRNQWFDARDVDQEVMEVEREFAGWKAVLNTTEFLLCQDLRLYVRWMEKYRTDVYGVWAYDFTMVDHPDERENEISELPFYFQKRWGYHSGGGRSRVLHRHPDMHYDTGRHSCSQVGKVIDDGLFLLWFGWCPIRYVKERKLQIQKRIPERDRAAGLGHQHIVTEAGLEQAYLGQATRIYDLWEKHPNYYEMIQYLGARTGAEVAGKVAVTTSR
jgi:Glycosyl transferase family 2